MTIKGVAERRKILTADLLMLRKMFAPNQVSVTRKVVTGDSQTINKGGAQ
jgi:hypothetical protein